MFGGGGGGGGRPLPGSSWTSSLQPPVWVSASVRPWPGPPPSSCLSPGLSPPWVAAMGRKRRLITDSFPRVKRRRKGGPGPGKGDRAPEPGLRGEEPGDEASVVLEEKSHLEILRQFDLDLQFGPCTGITRLQRWERAEHLGLDPPQEVLKVLWAHPEDAQYQCSLWYLYPI
ncbi:DNA polymerase delta subunit 4-like isoform X1 [Monodelphis domestica]|uniref:DNA polymerase delta subunit 4-like isoform X1 n=1 Tax=Monodelphis domestica TaxID=13616 RepID=UPI0024E2632E|nr:DNA polymerase delta subunit 4-like isoform X1 [Monodelphis domestica]